MKMLFFIYVISFSAFGSNLCTKKVQVKETITSFKANVLMPKIQKSSNIKEIFISCKMYNSTKIGDKLILPNDIKKFNEERILNFIPQGSMDRIEYELLRK